MATTTEGIWDQLGEDLGVFIRRRITSAADADDVLQDTFVRIHDNLGRLRDEDRVHAWVYRIARNAITDHHRRGRRMETLEQEIPAEEEEENLSIDVASWLGAMVEALPEPYREAVRLTEIEGLTQREAAARLGISHSGMKSRVQRGRTKLEEMMRQCCDIELDRRGRVIDYGPRSGCDNC